MKILLLSVRDDEKPAIQQWQERHPDIQLTSVEDELHPDTVEKVRGFDGIVIQQRSTVEASMYPQLHDMGIKQITTRTALKRLI